MKTKRLFIATPLPEDGQAVLTAWQNQVGALPGKPVPSAQWHLTWQFLGNVPESRLSPLIGDLVEATVPLQAPLLTLGTLAWWPSETRPQVLVWTGTASEELQRVATRLQQAVAGYCQEPPRQSFRPHVTITRLKTKPGERVQTPAPPPSFEWRLDPIVLYESELTPQGAIHTPLAVWAF